MHLPERNDAYDNAEPVVEVLARIHAELEDIARRIDHNQAMIAKATWAAGADDMDYVRAMQDADLSAQRIAGIADFLQAVSAASQPQWRIDTASATGTLKLSELIRSIGNPAGHVQAKDEADAGNVDLF
jgi:hypothetical protein